MHIARNAVRLAALALLLSAQGCAVFTPKPLWELVKVAGALASNRLQAQPGEASRIVVHPHQPISALCIEYNPQVQVHDLLPALQLALQSHRIESRIHDNPITGAKCQVWLRYSAQLQWGRHSHSDEQRAYMSNASLTLQTAHGEVLASSAYEVSASGRSKWATTHDKLLAAVNSLITVVSPGQQPYL